MTATTNPTTYSAIAKILDEVAEVDINALDLDLKLREDLDVDSLLLVEIVVALESEFGIAITDEDAGGFTTLGDLVDFVDDRTAAA